LPTLGLPTNETNPARNSVILCPCLLRTPSGRRSVLGRARRAR
jgi:hypothetical protein